jgi:hypothetical protein
MKKKKKIDIMNMNRSKIKITNVNMKIRIMNRKTKARVINTTQKDDEMKGRVAIIYSKSTSNTFMKVNDEDKLKVQKHCVQDHNHGRHTQKKKIKHC